jgi:NAD(P)-dependent dehydrogenase (short-subunit alcohol dehydrogenase family)
MAGLPVFLGGIDFGEGRTGMTAGCGSRTSISTRCQAWATTWCASWNSRSTTAQAVIVTGGVRYWPRHALALAETGVRVTLVNVSDDLAISAALEVGGTYGHLDVSQPDSWSQVPANFDHLDFLDLNSGIYDIEVVDVTQISDERYRAYIEVNIDGVFFGLRGALSLLERSNRAVVVTGSAVGLVRLPTNPLYSLPKFALTGLVRSVNNDLRRRNISLNALCRGAVTTHIMGPDPYAWYNEHGVAAFEPADLATTALKLLASDRSGEILLQVSPDPARPLQLAELGDFRWGR